MIHMKVLLSTIGCNGKVQYRYRDGEKYNAFTLII